MKNVLYGLYMMISLPVLGMTACEYSENPRSSFESYGDLSELIRKGWLPEYFPQTATDIRETHDIDTNEVNASFMYKESDLNEIAKACQEVGSSDVGATFLCPLHGSQLRGFTLLENGTGYYWSRDSGI